MTLTMFDAVSIEHIPGDATIVAGYVNGYWPTYNDLCARFPHAHHVSIAVTSGVVADVLDVERGDATPQDAPLWVSQMRALGRKPVVYCSVAMWPSVQAECAKSGVAEPFWWAADWTNRAHLHPGSVATQWADGTTQYPGLALYTDTSMVSPNFPGIYVPEPTVQQLAKVKLVGLPNPIQAKIAMNNGWPIKNWNGHAFVPAPTPGLLKEYTNLYYEHKRP
jgi:hypothetical protein